MTATKAHEITVNKRIADDAIIEERAEVYVNEVLYRHIEYMAMLGNERTIQLIPLCIDKRAVLNLLKNNDEYAAKLIGRLLLIKW
jgi:hypothetical protein